MYRFLGELPGEAMLLRQGNTRESSHVGSTRRFIACPARSIEHFDLYNFLEVVRAWRVMISWLVDDGDPPGNPVRLILYLHLFMGRSLRRRLLLPCLPTPLTFMLPGY
jgi:hypothetical protein